MIDLSNIVVIADNKQKYACADENRMIVFAGQPGPQGPQGTPGTDGADGADGRGITSITKTSTSGLVDTYTITYTDGTTSTFTVTNGSGGSWGSITGTLSNQSDLQRALNQKADIIKTGTETTLTGTTIAISRDDVATASLTKVVMPPVQSGSGDPSPSNIRGFSEIVKTYVYWSNEAYDRYGRIDTKTWSDDSVSSFYGGTWDLEAQTLTVTWGHIASYAGETLPGVWLSDRDVYAEGTTPTTGAEVCYELATPVTYQNISFSLNWVAWADTMYAWSNNGSARNDSSNPFTLEVALTEYTYHDTKTYIDEHDAQKAPVIIDTVSGSIASVTAAFEHEAEGLTVGIEPVQAGSGDPSPDNVRAITGWTEANIWRTRTNLMPKLTAGTYEKNGVTVVVDDTGLITVTGQKNVTGGIRIYIPFENSVYTNLPSGVYYHLRNSAVNSNIAFAIGSNSIALNTESRILQTSLSSGSVSRASIYFNASATEQVNFTLQPSVEATGDTTDFESYTGTSVTIALGQTIYGGSLDVLNGVLTVTKVGIDLSTLTWTLRNNGYFYTRDIDSLIAPPATNGRIADILCEKYMPDTATNIGDFTNDNVIGVNVTGTLFIYSSAITTESALMTALNNVKLVYTLATPLTVQLIANDLTLLAGENNVWADTGNVSLTYRADTKTYIAETVTEQQGIIGTVELGTASKNYSVNDFLLMNNTLYKVTANIGSGGTITVGTNVTATTIAEQLTALLNA